jgi:uncharacterized alpha-E superfamily protein
MLSRVAESIYWMARYLERAENVARFIEANLTLALDLGPEVANQWSPLVATTGDEKTFAGRYGEASQTNVLQFLTFDEQNPNSIIACLRAARENARTVRDIISAEMWEELNTFYLFVQQASAAADLFEFYGKIRRHDALSEGLADSTMSRGEAWHFRRLGKLIERADQTSRILDVKYYVLLPRVSDVGTPLDTNQWAALLKSASALDMYRQKYGRIAPPQVAEFLILDRNFPRAMHFCLHRAELSLMAITGGAPAATRTSAEQRLGRLRAELDYADIREIIGGGLHEFIDAFQTKLNAVGAAIHETFFAVQPVGSAPGPPQLLGEPSALAGCHSSNA